MPSLWSNVYVNPRTSVSVGLVAPSIANLLPPEFTTVTANVCVPENIPATLFTFAMLVATVVTLEFIPATLSVSYTHLTLPTKRIV